MTAILTLLIVLALSLVVTRVVAFEHAAGPAAGEPAPGDGHEA